MKAVQGAKLRVSPHEHWQVALIYYGGRRTGIFLEDETQPRPQRRAARAALFQCCAHLPVEYHATMESCSDKFHVDIPNVV
jgi:hypothetical protein